MRIAIEPVYRGASFRGADGPNIIFSFESESHACLVATRVEAELANIIYMCTVFIFRIRYILIIIV